MLKQTLGEEIRAVQVVGRWSDRLLAAVLPQAVASADPVCDPGHTWWGAHCFCDGIWNYAQYCQCNGTGTAVSCPCTRQGPFCV